MSFSKKLMQIFMVSLLLITSVPTIACRIETAEAKAKTNPQVLTMRWAIYERITSPGQVW